MAFSRPCRPSLSIHASPFPSATATPQHTQIRHATLLRRPKRPYTFTQLVVLSDGSTYTHRTTSPAPVYKSQKDSRNTLLWNPSSRKTLGAQSDEAGKMKAFRDKYGEAWRSTDAIEVEKDEKGGEKETKGQEVEEEEGNEGAGAQGLMDMIGEYGRTAEVKGQALGAREDKKKSGKGKGGQR